MVSGGNAMAGYVQDTGCGRVVPGVEKREVMEAIRQLRQSYEMYRTRAAEVGKRDFSAEELVTAHRDLYRALSGGPPG
jgi:hypothetical protein